MLDKIWELFTSDNRLDRLLMRVGLLIFLAAVFFISSYLSIELLLGLGILIAGVIIFLIFIKRAQKKADDEWNELMNSEDDGVTGYIPVRPEELEAAPWEVRQGGTGKKSIVDLPGFTDEER